MVLGESGATSPAPRKRRWPMVLIIVVVLVGAIIGAFFIADGLARGAAQSAASAAVTQRIPGAENVKVDIGGPIFLLQVARGSLDDVELTVDGAQLGGAPVDISAHASGVPLDTDKPVATLDGTARLSADALNVLIAASGHEGAVSLADGGISYEVTRSVLGIPLSFTVTATPEATGPAIVFHPTGAQVAAGSAAIDVSGIVDAIIADEGLSVCVASELPAGVSIDSVTVTDAAALVSFSAKNLALSDASNVGSC